ncbi:MAG TPA: ABC transporter substrate-binding protein [Pseudolabrys sp.]|nr:ABC transporter substrate-binding protein [Pseudolabrys sp.]
MKRRDFITLLAGAAVLWPRMAWAQRTTPPVVGFLGFGTASASANRVAALREGLRELGYVEGKNITIEFRWAETIDELRERAAELVRMNVDVIFATSSTEVGAAKEVTKAIPIVFATHADPIGTGHVTSLPRPGGNITGLSVMQSDLTAKALAILKEAVPQLTRLGVFWNSTVASGRPTLQSAEAAGAKLGIQIYSVPVRASKDFDGAFATMARERVGGVFVAASTLTRVERTPLAQLAIKHRLPSMFGTRENVEAGGLMSYAPDQADLTRRAATYIDKILKGDKPAGLPVEQASKYRLAINLGTAKQLGLHLPPTLLALADDLID